MPWGNEGLLQYIIGNAIMQKHRVIKGYDECYCVCYSFEVINGEGILYYSVSAMKEE